MGCAAKAVEEVGKVRPWLETSEFWRGRVGPTPLEARAGLVRVYREGPPRTLEVPRTVVVIVVEDIGEGGGGRRKKSARELCGG